MVEGEHFRVVDPTIDLIDSLKPPSDVIDEHTPRSLADGECIGRFKVHRFIASGGMGEVYEVQEVVPRPGKSELIQGPVALKILGEHLQGDPKVMAMLAREAKVCRAIHSRHVVRVHEYGRDPRGKCYIAMEMLRGEELFSKLQRMPVFPPKLLGRTAVQILRGLHTIHRAGVVHRDLKPENVFILDEGQREAGLVKLLDFGTALLRGDEAGEADHELIGTPAYMSPEQWQGPQVDHRADLYSLGVILYECASGGLPFKGETPYATMHAHQSADPPRLPSTVDPEFGAIIMRALAKNPNDRWQSAEEMREVVERWLEEFERDEIQVRRTPVPRRHTRRARAVKPDVTRAPVPKPRSEVPPEEVPFDKVEVLELADVHQNLPRRTVATPVPIDPASTSSSQLRRIDAPSTQPSRSGFELSSKHVYGLIGLGVVSLFATFVWFLLGPT